MGELGAVIFITLAIVFGMVSCERERTKEAYIEMVKHCQEVKGQFYSESGSGGIKFGCIGGKD
jgi:hypothetical protein